MNDNAWFWSLTIDLSLHYGSDGSGTLGRVSSDPHESLSFGVTSVVVTPFEREKSKCKHVNEKSFLDFLH